MMDLKPSQLQYMHILCFTTYQKKLYIDKELVKSQIESIKENEEKYYDIPHLTFSYDGGKEQAA